VERGIVEIRLPGLIRFSVRERNLNLMCTECKVGEEDSAEFERERALSVPKGAGRRVLYKTGMHFRRWFCRGRPLFGRAGLRFIRYSDCRDAQ